MSAIPLSQQRTHGDVVYTAGQVGREPDGTIPSGFAQQMELAMAALRDRLEEAGSSLGQVLKATVFIVRREHFAEMNELYARWFSDPWPARSTIVTELAAPELLFEIEVVAALDAG